MIYSFCWTMNTRWSTRTDSYLVPDADSDCNSADGHGVDSVRERENGWETGWALGSGFGDGACCGPGVYFGCGLATWTVSAALLVTVTLRDRNPHHRWWMRDPVMELEAGVTRRALVVVGCLLRELDGQEVVDVVVVVEGQRPGPMQKVEVEVVEE